MAAAAAAASSSSAAPQDTAQGPFAVVWWSHAGGKGERPHVEFLLCGTHSEAVEELQNVIEDSWADSDADDDYFFPPLKPEDVFIRPVKLENGAPDFVDAEWVVIEMNPGAHDEQSALAMFHSYDSLGTVPPGILIQLMSGNPYFTLGHYSHANIGQTFGALEIANPILKSLRDIIAKYDLVHFERK